MSQTIKTVNGKEGIESNFPQKTFTHWTTIKYKKNNEIPQHDALFQQNTRLSHTCIHKVLSQTINNMMFTECNIEME